MYSWLTKKIGRPSSKFNVGDSVQLTTGGPLMVVIAIYTSRKLAQPFIECQWSEGKVKHTNLFLEKNIQLFDWLGVK